MTDFSMKFFLNLSTLKITQSVCVPKVDLKVFLSPFNSSLAVYCFHSWKYKMQKSRTAAVFSFDCPLPFQSTLNLSFWQLFFITEILNILKDGCCTFYLRTIWHAYLDPCWQSTGTMKHMWTMWSIGDNTSRARELHRERYIDIQIHILIFAYL